MPRLESDSADDDLRRLIYLCSDTKIVIKSESFLDNCSTIYSSTNSYRSHKQKEKGDSSNLRSSVFKRHFYDVGDLKNSASNLSTKVVIRPKS